MKTGHTTPFETGFDTGFTDCCGNPIFLGAFIMIIEKKKMMIVPKEQQKLGTAMNGRDSLILFLTESLGIECKDDKIDFSSNAELMKILSKKKNGI